MNKKFRSEGPVITESEVVPLTPVDTTPRTVGELLRSKREEFGIDLHDAADYLRIRYAYLSAIEDGQVDDLPGATYAMGFVRAYAEYLGLDGPAIVERYKNETTELSDDVRLVFPSPLPEGKVPSGAILLIAAIAAGLIYGGWALFAQQNIKIAEIVPALPESFKSMLGSDEPRDPNAVPETALTGGTEAPVVTGSAAAQLPAPVEQDAATPEPSAPETTIPVTAAQAETATEAPAATEQTAAAETSVAPSEQGRTETTADSSAAEAPAATVTADTAPTPTVPAVETPRIGELTAGRTDSTTAVATESTTTEPAAPAVSEESAPPVPQAVASEDAARPSVETPAESAQTAETSDEAAATAAPPAAESLSQQTAALPPQPPAQPSSEPRQYGSDNAVSRVRIKARVDSWVEVRDSGGELLLTRVLRTGDSYRVPDRPGVVMLTGNAGGLEITVDGSVIPDIGPLGAVRHDVPLDAESLKAGVSRR